MLAYQATKRQFVEDVCNNVIHKKILAALGTRASHGEISSWRNSLGFMERAIRDEEIPDDAGVAIEFGIPLTAKRVDFILSGKNHARRDSVVIVELKQWSYVKKTQKDGVVITRYGPRETETSHPSYQAWSYAALIQDYNETVQNDGVLLAPCAYLHNMDERDVINDSFYSEYTGKAPSFISSDAAKLTDFLKNHVKYGDTSNLMYRIENGKIKPSKSLVDCLVSMLEGNVEFLMIDDQKVVFESARAAADRAQSGHKDVLIVHGGPGTGKSVIAINLLVDLTASGFVVNYVSRNAAPRDVYTSRLAQGKVPPRIRNLFKGSGMYMTTAKNTFDALIVDEAHRLNEKSGLFSKGENQIKEIINAAKASVFFLDEDQRVTFRDIGEATAIREWAKKAGARVSEFSLQSQFRCNGSDGYLAWLDNALQIRKTANQTLDEIDYVFKVFDDPRSMHSEIERQNRANNKSRVVAGYCWDWGSKKEAAAMDIEIGSYRVQWNFASYDTAWIEDPNSVAQVGCIHTCQGLELDYVGVMMGPDLVVRNGDVVTNGNERSKNDSSIKGFKKLMKSNPTEAMEKADLIIKNTYRTLMTRGLKGCFLHCTDRETNEYFRRAMSSQRQLKQVADDAPDYGH